MLAAWRWRFWLAALIYAACAAAFIADLSYDIPWAFGVFYLPLVCTAVLYRDPRCTWWFAGGAIAMVLAGFVLPVVNLSTGSLMNRGLSIVAIVATALLVRLAGSMQLRLELQTQQAQAADRLKTQIFSSLSSELRAPSRAIIKLAEALAPTSPASQRGVLDQLQAAAQRLSLTIENLLDLAEATDRALHLEMLDIAGILRQAVDDVRHVAAEKHIWLESIADSVAVQALGDAWAVRRIADNLVGNALKFTPRGGHVRAGVEAEQDRVVVVVEDTGPGMPSEMLQRLGEPFLQSISGRNHMRQGLGNGLALCRKLANGMGATLSFSSEPGEGTTVRLRLRAA